ncbi:SNARE protein Syntaxin 1 [Trachipleistophora hominis]|uniref:SNARE protein Syntaxin 1 n=1 Tax=Trachipleistophora hominis TaxID=72359 RepID=L7JZE0_TRAHO|nr:SNARE protein Syntaxin 1 [Trachipleistophora hominis]
MDEFLGRCKKIEDEIDKLRQYIHKLKVLSNRKANSILSDREETELDNRITVLNNMFKENSKRVKEKLKDMHEENKEISPEDEEFEADTRNNRWQVLTNYLAETIELYRTEQLNHTKEEKQRLKAQFLIAKPDATEDELHDLVNSSEGHKLLEKEFKPGARSSKGILKKAGERNKNIKNIVNSINELVSLIDELHEMVMNSRKIVDNIEIEIDVTRKTVKEAKKDLEKARNYQKAAMYIKYVILFIFALAISFLIIGVILFALAKLFFSSWQGENKNGNKLKTDKNSTAQNDTTE